MSAATHSWIDPHVHLFALQEGDYHWLKPNNPPFWPDKDVIAKSTYEHHLRRASKGKLTGFVHIEAGFDNERPWREIDFRSKLHYMKHFNNFFCHIVYDLFGIIIPK